MLSNTEISILTLGAATSFTLDNTYRSKTDTLIVKVWNTHLSFIPC